MSKLDNLIRKFGMKSVTKYICKKKFKILLMVLLCIGMILTIVRWVSAFNDNIIVINSEINSHISNLSLSMILYLGIGYSWLINGMKFRYIVILGVILSAGNLLCETLMGFMNTTDIVDAIYGIIGISVSFVYLFVLNNYGLLKAKPV